MILEYIYDHGSISNTEAVINLHVGRLSGRIKDLRNDGWDIVTDMVYGYHTRFAKYRFSKHQKDVLCKCPKCGCVYDFNDAENWKERWGRSVEVFTECPKCGESTCEYEYEDERPFYEVYGNPWAGREI